MGVYYSRWAMVEEGTEKRRFLNPLARLRSCHEIATYSSTQKTTPGRRAAGPPR